MRFGPIQDIFSTKQFNEYICTHPIPNLPDLFKLNLLRNSDFNWQIRIIYSNTDFIINNFRHDRFEYTIGIMGTNVGCAIIFEQYKYDDKFWNQFPSQIIILCDQLIIYHIHNL